MQRLPALRPVCWSHEMEESEIWLIEEQSGYNEASPR
jgi:hypothetical protein